MHYIGIDIAKNNHEVGIIDEAGQKMADSFSIANSEAGFSKLLKVFAKVGIDQNEDIVGMEATGHYWIALYSHLIDLGFASVIVAEIGDISHFDKLAQIIAFAGMDMPANQSGEFSGTKKRISKRGSSSLRWALIEAADKC